MREMFIDAKENAKISTPSLLNAGKRINSGGGGAAREPRAWGTTEVQDVRTDRSIIE